jgi:hypothetical protein
LYSSAGVRLRPMFAGASVAVSVRDLRQTYQIVTICSYMGANGMAFVVLGQKIETDSTYEDIPFSRYHFPRTYKNQVREGDRFLYHQGNQGPQLHKRYYFGYGVVGEIYPDPEKPGSLYAELLDARPLPQKVSAYRSPGAFFESIAYDSVRKSLLPNWRQSVRPISQAAFETILEKGGVDQDELAGGYIVGPGALNSPESILDVLQELNQRYLEATPAKRSTVANRYLDRGTAVVGVLKRLLGAQCQICGVQGFATRSGQDYVEAHHLIEVSRLLAGSLCSDNVILVCPTCHRKLHHAPVTYEATEKTVAIRFTDRSATIPRNTATYLAQRVSQIL